MEIGDFSSLYGILTEENLTPLDVVGGDKLICTNQQNERFVVKKASGLEETMYSEILPAIRIQNHAFETLQLPECHKIIEKNSNNEKCSYLILKYYSGENFNLKWDESLPEGFGGRGVEIEMVEKSIKVLRDFTHIDIPRLSEFNLPSFNFQKWLIDIFPEITKELVEANVLTNNQVKRTKKIFDNPNCFKHSQPIVTNGDFYPRNFIQLPNGKIVVLDWEIRTDQTYRNAPINYLENHLAFLYVHMWGNNRFQRELLKAARDTFHLSDDNLQAAIILKSLEQAKLWLPYLESGSHLSLGQAQILINTLDKENLYG